MNEIYIRKVGEDWAGFVDEKQITKPACKACILKLLKNITVKSNRYKEIIVINEDGTENHYRTGADDGRTAEETR